MRRALIVVPLLLVSSPAFAQLVKATVMTNSQTLPTTALDLNIEDINDDAYIELEFTAVAPALQAYEYQLSYDNVLTVNTTTVTFIHLDPITGEPEATGTIISGQLYTVRIRPSQIVRARVGDEEHLP